MNARDHQIENNQVRFCSFHPFPSHLTIIGLDDSKALLFKVIGNQFDNVFLIVYDQDFFLRHHSVPI